MKNLYRIISRNGATLCFQLGRSEAEALDFARMCGHRGSAAEFVRED